MEDGSTKERKLALFWDERIKSSCYWIMFVNFLQFSTSIESILKPKTEELKLIAPFYLMCSIVSFILLYFYYSKKCNTAYGVIILVIIRSNIRLFDIENTRTLDEETEWYFKVIYQSLAIVCHTTTFFACSPATKCHIILTMLLWLFMILAIMCGTYTTKLMV